MDIRLDGARTCDRCGRRKAPFAPHLCRSPIVQKQSPVANVAITPPLSWTEQFDRGPAWAPTRYGEYFASSVLVYAAVKMRADNLTRAPLRVYQGGADGADKGDLTEVAPNHPLSQLLSKVNPQWTFTHLMRAISIYLDLWGSCPVALTKDSPESPPRELWPMRPDRVRVVPDAQRYIAGYVYENYGRKVALLPSEVLWLRYFNPLDEFAGLSPIAPLRLSVDMARDALSYNRNIFQNGMLWGNVAIETQATPTEAEVDDFYGRLKKRFSGPDNAWRPLVLNNGMKASNLGLSQREMEYLSTLRWSLEDVSRALQIPKLLLGDLERATYSNIDAAERMFWRNTIVPQLTMIAGEINEFISPQFGPDLSVAFDLSQIEALQPNYNEMALRQREDVRFGILTINEVRADRGLEPVPWGDVPPVVPASGRDTANTPGAATTEQQSYRTKAAADGLSPMQRKEYAALHLKRMDRREAEFDALQKHLFREQRADVLRRLAAKPSLPVVGKAVDDGALFDAAAWVRHFISSGMPVLRAAMVAGGDAAVRDFGLGAGFNANAQAVLRWLDARVALWAQEVNRETAQMLINEITQGLQAGEAIPDIQRRVERVFDFADLVRSERIARTEVQATVNHGTLAAYQQSDVVTGKEWLATNDDRTRDDHLEANGQTVPLNAKFVVGGEELDHPGDGSAAQSVNCRCTLVPVLSERKAWKSSVHEDGAGKVRPMVKRLIRNEDGLITGIEEVSANA